MSTKSVAQIQKETLRVVDKQLFFDRLNTLYTLYGVEGVVVFMNDWLATLNDSTVYHVDLIMDTKRDYQEHVDHHAPGSDINCPWCEEDYQNKLEWEKDQYAKAEK